MKTVWRQGHWLPRLLGVQAITLYPFVLLADKAEGLSREQLPVWVQTVCHEWIHVREIRARGWFRFYGTYLWEFVTAFLKTRSYDKAYRAVGAEQRAYGGQDEVQLEVKEILEMVGR